MSNFKPTHNCGELNISNANEMVILSGWVNKRRDLGTLIFIDLRDRNGITQLIFDVETSKEEIEKASLLRNEWIISIYGKVKARKEGLENKKMKTGAIEIEVKKLFIISKSKPLPFPIHETTEILNEESRLKYKYLDLRRKPMYEKMKMKHTVMQEVRNFLTSLDFIEVTTPILCKSSPEGARDYLVPSRLYPSNFYALPQSPQIFKQLLMMGGMEKYFQIATCFRDEDLRADRQPEFMQIDIEMSFQEKKDVFTLVEKMMQLLFKKCLNVDIKTPFPHISYNEALDKFGTDKPDIRFNMKLVLMNDIFKKCEFPLFKKHLNDNNLIKAFCIEDAQDISRKKIEKFAEFLSIFGKIDLVWMKKTDQGYSSSLTKFLSAELLLEIENKFAEKVKEGALILFLAGEKDVVNQGADQLRRLIAKQKNIIKKDSYKFLWVEAFPMFHEEEGALISDHHPFTAPLNEIEEKNPLKTLSSSYDLVLNGYELASGSKRINDVDLQKKIFELLGLSNKEMEEKFGFFLEALSFGAPPHIGIAIGLERLLMIMTNTENIKDTIAFPKTQKANDLMMRCPSEVEKKQLDELHLKIIE